MIEFDAQEREDIRDALYTAIEDLDDKIDEALDSVYEYYTAEDVQAMKDRKHRLYALLDVL